MADITGKPFIQKVRYYMKELFEKWAEVQKRRPRAGLANSPELERVADEIKILEALLANGFYNIPGETRDVRSLLETRLRRWREMQT